VVFSKPTYPVVHHAPPVSLAVSNFRVSDWALVLGATALSYPIGYHLIGTLLASASLSLARSLDRSRRYSLAFMWCSWGLQRSHRFLVELEAGRHSSLALLGMNRCHTPPPTPCRYQCLSIYRDLS